MLARRRLAVWLLLVPWRRWQCLLICLRRCCLLAGALGRRQVCLLLLLLRLRLEVLHLGLLLNLPNLLLRLLLLLLCLRSLLPRTAPGALRCRRVLLLLLPLLALCTLCTASLHSLPARALRHRRRLRRGPRRRRRLAPPAPPASLLLLLGLSLALRTLRLQLPLAGLFWNDPLRSAEASLWRRRAPRLHPPPRRPL